MVKATILAAACGLFLGYLRTLFSYLNHVRAYAICADAPKPFWIQSKISLSHDFFRSRWYRCPLR
jgi:hypothetical protein